MRQPARLSIVTFGPTAEVHCTGRFDCLCEPCAAERARIIARGAQGAGNASPFKVRRAA